MTVFLCNETNIIIEETYEEISAGFCIVEDFYYVYKSELPKFNEIPGEKPYGLPCGDKPRKEYAGIGNISHEKQAQSYEFYIESCSKSECEVIEIRDTLFSREYCDVVWFRVYGSDELPPNGYVFLGYDITFPPELDGAFSIINDCMFICKWHGCDDEGIAFSEYFSSLNQYGLFDDVEKAISYLKFYLSFDWSERGEFCICEIFRKLVN